MKRNALQIYALAVCFVGIVTTAGCVAGALVNIANLLFPSLQVGEYTYRQFADNDTYWNTHKMKFADGKSTERERPSEDQLTNEREAALKTEAHINESRYLSNIIDFLIWAAVAALVFAGHWRIAKRQATLSESSATL